MDYVILGIIFLGIGSFIYRRVTKKGSSCSSCSGCALSDSCSSSSDSPKE